jgi:RNA polymerase sigma factor (sigma-70 family)
MGMDDREIVAAIAAGDLAGLADAFDEYAESLYGYCRWMLHEPADADDALQETFVITAGRVGGLQDPRKLYPWLYAVARNECHRRAHAKQIGVDETADVAGMTSTDPGTEAERAELRRLVRTALAGLTPGEREVLELELRHDLHGADLAAVLGVSRHEAHALTSSVRGKLDKALGALLVARTGRRACFALDAVLADWDGRLTAATRKRITQHADQCEVCDNRRRGALRPAALFGMSPLAALPLALRREVLRLCADDSPETLAYRHEVTMRAGPFGPNGFPATVRQPKSRLLVLTRVAAAAGIVVAIASAGIVAALALGGSHSPHSLDAARASRGSAASSTAAAPATSSGTTTASPSPTATASSTPGQALATMPSSSATTAKPSPSHTAKSSAPSPRPSTSSATPTPTVTPTPTATTTPTPSPSTPSPTPTTTSSLGF